ncbi:MAG: GNAT family N-acetyltransferase [Chloroflexi bacterium RBG_16_56_11]|nr:MAG: GNAT family N-acetyltransferase [Chloroflexi bacterium RBG_16_56_11]
MVYQVEKARIPDITQIHKLINLFADKGQMLPRPLSEIYESIRDFFVIRDGERVIASAALHVCWSDLAEIRSVAVAEDNQGQGLGSRLVTACLREAESLGIETVFCFTYRPEFFKRFRFADIDKMELPRKVWTDCFRCAKFPNCDETALVYRARKESKIA